MSAGNARSSTHNRPQHQFSAAGADDGDGDDNEEQRLRACALRPSPEFQEACLVLSNKYDIPGPFVVLQGMPGDGMANTIDSMPELTLMEGDNNDNDNDDDGEELPPLPRDEDNGNGNVGDGDGDGDGDGNARNGNDDDGEEEEDGPTAANNRTSAAGRVRMGGGVHRNIGGAGAGAGDFPPRTISPNLSLSNCSTSINSNSNLSGVDQAGYAIANVNADLFESTSDTSSLEVIHHPLDDDHDDAHEHQHDHHDSSSATLPLNVDIDHNYNNHTGTRTRMSTGTITNANTNTNTNTINPPRTQAIMTNHGLNLPIPQVASMSGCTYNSILPPLGVPYTTAAVAAAETTKAAKARHNVRENQIDDSFIMVDDRRSGSKSAPAPSNTDANANDFIQATMPPPSSSSSLSSSFKDVAAADIGGAASSSSSPNENPDDNPRYASVSASHMQSLRQWDTSSRQHELRLRQEMLLQSSRASYRLDPSSYTTAANTTSATTDPSSMEDLWWRGKGGCLIVFDAPPMDGDDNDQSGTTRTQPKIVGELAPGTTVMGTEMICIDTETTRTESSRPRATTQPKNHRYTYHRQGGGVVQILKIESPMVGYIVYSIDGYTLVGPGLPSSYVEPDVFLWKVTCPNGAYVRQGLELTSVHVDTIPFGSFVRVMRKTINAMGLTRLQIEALVVEEGHDQQQKQQQQKQCTESSSHIATRGTTRARNLANSLLRLGSTKGSAPNPEPNEEGKTKIVSGWISETLNPLSGQSGPVVQAVPFPVPALFRVILPEGAVIRSGIELSSPQIGHAPMGSVLNIVGRGFTQHPMDCCIQRLKLAGGGGWVSVRLNRSPPRERPLVLKQIGIDGSFDPDAAGLFHIEKQLLVIHEFNLNLSRPDESDRQNMENVRRSLQRLGSCVSSINDDDENLGDSGELSTNDSSMTSSHVPALYRSGVANEGTATNQRKLKGYGNKAQKDDPCLICLTEERNSTIVHGETGHIACCLACARILKARGDKCPVCRLPIDSIIQQFWA